MAWYCGRKRRASLLHEEGLTDVTVEEELGGEGADKLQGDAVAAKDVQHHLLAPRRVLLVLAGHLNMCFLF